MSTFCKSQAEPVGRIVTFDAHEIQKDFPILAQQINGHPLVYLDNAATTQKPDAVIDAVCDYYRTCNANVHRGAHTLSDRATEVFEAGRSTVATFLNSASTREILWTRGTTESVNLIASSWGRANVSAGDKIIVSTLEHHSNIVPWQMLAAETGATLLPLPISDDGEFCLDTLASLLDRSVKMVAIGHVSNALGTVNPVAKVVELAKTVGAKIFIDGAQAVAHFPIDVQALGCDFYAFSGHKLFGPTGIGVLWGREELLNDMPPYHGGGEMIETCSFSGTHYNILPYKFEAGTPNIAGAIGLAAAISYLQQFDRAAIIRHEQEVLKYCHEKATSCAGLQRVGTASSITGVFSFLLKGSHPSDVGMLLDQQGVAVRTGHHCAQPLMEALGIPGTVRASFSLYNTCEDVDSLFAALDKVKQFL